MREWGAASGCLQSPHRATPASQPLQICPHFQAIFGYEQDHLKGHHAGAGTVRSLRRHASQVRRKVWWDHDPAQQPRHAARYTTAQPASSPSPAPP